MTMACNMHIYREEISGNLWCSECDNLLSDCCCNREVFEQRQVDDIVREAMLEDEYLEA